MAGIPTDSHMAFILDKRVAFDRLSASARHQAMPTLYARPETSAKEHWITVDCRTGARTVDQSGATRQTAARPMELRVIGNLPAKFKSVVRQVCIAFDAKPHHLVLPGKSMKMAYARYACFRLLNHLHHWSAPQTAAAFSRDKSTVLHGLERARELYAQPGCWRARYEAALRGLKKSAATP